jgi:LuxR family maltose regulon positive regulatory protein
VSVPIVNTKFFIPPPQKQLAHRPRLIETLIEGLDRKLTLVSAPAGFGKTTLLSECILKCDTPAAWITLDDGDNDNIRFLTYFISAINRITTHIGGSILDALNTDQPPDTEILLSGLINEIAENNKPFVIVLDDYHTITNQDVHNILTFILENQPPNMHLVVSSRADPPWPLARWRVRREIMEIRTQDLRFSPEETTTLLNEVMDLHLSSEDILKLDARTEGWVAGLLMAALSLSGREDGSDFIQTFAGSHRFIFDYLVEDVLDTLSLEIQNFLLKTSILGRLCAPLCDAILETRDSQSVLQKLVHMNMFIIPLDEQRFWYRYHHLFSDLLNSLQNEKNPEVGKTIHLRASLWHEANGNLFEAVNHAFEAGDLLRVAQLAEADVLGIMERGEMGLLIKWLDQLPGHVVDSHPWLRVAQAWALTQAGSIEGAIPCLLSAEVSLKTLTDKSDEKVNHIMGHIAAVRCYIELISIGDYDRASRLAHRSLELLPETDMKTRGKVAVYLGTIQRIVQDLPSALDTLNTTINIYHPTNQPYVIIDILAQIARIRREQGQLHETSRVCQEALEIADTYARDGQHRLPVAAYVMGVLGRVYYEWNQLDKALEIGSQALELSKRWGQANTLMGNHLLMAKVYRAQGKYPLALKEILSAKRAGSRFSDTHAFVIGTQEVALRLAMGDFRTAAQWLNHGSLSFDTDPDERLWELASIILALYQAEQVDLMSDLAAALDRLLAASAEKGIQRRLIKANIQQAVVHHILGENDCAFTYLDRALTPAASEGYIRSFIDLGPSMADLLKMAISAGINTNYANELLLTLQVELLLKDDLPQSKPDLVVDPLTERETEVLRLLAADLSINEIAALLVISIGTLRTHTKRIYHKLGVHSRFEAVTRGKESGFI